jgi:ubiquitin C-terminal hydrolase
MDPLFRGAKANDSKDLVNFIIMKLHEELNEVNSNKIITTVEPNQLDENLMLNYFKENLI